MERNAYEGRSNDDSREDTFKQFAAIDSGLWAWTFVLQNAEGRKWPGRPITNFADDELIEG